MESSPASFLNLDLEIDSGDDLAPLAEYLKGCAFVLYLGPAETGFRLSLEPLIDSQLCCDPLACTEYFIALLEALPTKLAGVWAATSSRILDYGFDGGLECPPIRMDLPAPLLARIAKLRLDLRVTIYPFREGMADES